MENEKKLNHGGARVGSGRKPLPESEKKVKLQLYLSPKDAEKVLALVEKLKSKR